MEERTTVKITTTVDIEKWKHAIINKIRWCDALSIGIDVLCGGEYVDEQTIKKEIESVEIEKKKLDAKKSLLNKKLEDIKENKNNEHEEKKRRFVA